MAMPASAVPAENPRAKPELLQVSPSVRRFAGTRRSASENPEMRAGATAAPERKVATASAGTDLMNGMGMSTTARTR